MIRAGTKKQYFKGLGRVENGILIEGIREVLSVEDFKKTALKTGKTGLLKEELGGKSKKVKYLSLEGGGDERS